MGPFNFIFLSEYMISPIYMHKADCEDLCSNDGNTLGKLSSSFFTLNSCIWNPYFRVPIELAKSA